MEQEIHGAIFKVTHNAYDFTAQDGTHMVGTAHHVFVLDFGEGKTADDDGSERQIVDVRVSDEQVAALGKLLAKDSDVHWKISIRPNGNKFRFDLLAPIAAPLAKAS